MKFTLNLLKKYINTSLGANQISELLNKIGFEVEDFINLGETYSQFKVAEILTAEQHPAADRLKICTVDDGENILQIVCGAHNARGGIKVVLAPIGSIIPFNQMVIKKSQIRGVESNGMLCSGAELMLSHDGDGIIELPQDVKIGLSFSKHQNLEDAIFEIALTPNRGDALSVRGIARDLIAAGAGELIRIEYKSVKGSYPCPIEFAIQDKENCQEFTIRHVSNIRVDITTGSEISSFLEKTGCSVKNSIVDISNFAMFSNGRPNHFYDADKIIGAISIRQSFQDEEFIALGGVKYILPAGITVIADDQKILAIAGVMGGELSKVDEATKNILIEVANFRPEVVSMAGRVLNLLTDGRYRFERRVDADPSFMDYISSLIFDHCGDHISFSDVKRQEGYGLGYISEILFDFEDVKKITGCQIERTTAIEILEKLGFSVICQDEDLYRIVIPSYRQGDIEGAPDIVEEIIRIYGLDNIPNSQIDYSVFSTPELNKEDIVRNLLVGNGMYEVIKWSFISEKVASLFKQEDQVFLENPITEEMKVMRSTCLPGLLDVAYNAFCRGKESVEIFEIGNIYSALKEQLVVCGLRAGAAEKKSPHNLSEREYDFYDVKSDVLTIFSKFNISENSVSVYNNVLGEPINIPEGISNNLGNGKQEALDRNRKVAPPSYYHPGKSCSFYFGKQLIGYCGELHPSIVSEFKISKKVLAFEVYSEVLPNCIKRKSKQLSEFQFSERDFAFIIDAAIPFQKVKDAINKLNISAIMAIELFDVYHPKPDEGKKSLAIRVKMQHLDKNLIDGEIEDMCARITAAVIEKTGGSLRGM